MRKIARRPLWQAGLATALGVLLIGTGLLAACSTTSSDLPTNPANGAANPASLQLASGPTPVRPQPRGNAATGASFGPNVGSLQLPPTPPLPAAVTTAAPPVAGARPTQATGPLMPGVAPTATAAAINVQGQTVLAKPPDVRYRLVYVRADNQLWSVSRAGNDPQVLLAQPAGQEPAGHVTDLNLSPDGNKLLYTVTDGAPTPRVFLLNLADGTLRREPVNGAWAYDSRHVAASVDNQLHVVDVTTGQDTPLGEGSHPGWTADNQILAVRQGNVWLIPYPAASGTPQALTSFAASGDGSWTFFGPLVYQYTNKVVFAGAPTASLQGNGNGIRVESVDMPTHRVTELLPAGGADLGTLTLSPSETQLAVAEQAATDACASQGQIRVVRVAGGAATTVPLGSGNPSAFAVQGLTWSPDQWLAYGGVERTCANGQATAAGPAHVYLVNPASPGTLRAIVEGADPVWVMPRGLGLVPAGAVAGR